MPPAEVPAAIMGGSWDSCPWLIFALALPGLAATLRAMRGFAPTRTARPSLVELSEEHCQFNHVRFCWP